VDHQPPVVTVACPGDVIVISPAQLHMAVHGAVSAGSPLIVTVGAPGIHGEAVCGMHGWGVSTPRAAEVAAATWGLASDMHMPKLGMFSGAMKCHVVAAGWPPIWTGAPPGVATSGTGVAPNEHAMTAPFTANSGTARRLRPGRRGGKGETTWVAQDPMAVWAESHVDYLDSGLS
jgi:hypothetical protein